MRRQNALVLVICTTALGLLAAGIIDVTHDPKAPPEPVYVVHVEPPGLLVQGRLCVLLEHRYANGRFAWRTSVLHGGGGSSYSMGGPEAESYVRHGTFTAYYENGKIRKRGLYFEGKKRGRWRYWAADGELLREEVHRVDVPRTSR